MNFSPLRAWLRHFDRVDRGIAPAGPYSDGGIVFGATMPPLKPRIRWYVGGWWICQHTGTELGRGGTPAAAYQDWLDKRRWRMPDIYGRIQLWN
jgi:hypothetical protein